VVYDRGYFSYAMLYAHKKRGVDASRYTKVWLI